MWSNRHEFFNGSSLNFIMRAAIQVLLRHGQLFCHVKWAPTICHQEGWTKSSQRKRKTTQSTWSQSNGHEYQSLVESFPRIEIWVLKLLSTANVILVSNKPIAHQILQHFTNWTSHKSTLHGITFTLIELHSSVLCDRSHLNKKVRPPKEHKRNPHSFHTSSLLFIQIFLESELVQVHNNEDW